MTLAEIKQTTGMIVPVWFPESMSEAEMARVLRPALEDVEPFAESRNVVVVVDGAPKAHEMVLALRKKLKGFEVLFLEENAGKGGAVAAGIERMLENASVEYIVPRDHDNDHLANDAVNLVRLAAQMRRDTGNDLVVTIGRRSSIHRHLGFVRGEYEWMINEVCFEATKFALAREGRALTTQYFAAYEMVPDMQTGFKCYTRASGKLFCQTLQGAGKLTPGLDVRRHGAEVPVLVETLLRGGTVGEVNRLAWENQPLTTYDLAARVQVKGAVLAWALQRTNVPPSVARQLLTNAIARRVMAKEEKGVADLLSLANWTLEKLATLRNEKIEPIQQPKLSEYF